MENSDEHVKALVKAVVSGTDIQYLGLTDAQLLGFLHAASFYMGGSRELVNAVAIEPDNHAETLTIYWIANESIGALSVRKPERGSSAMPPISGWLRSLRSIDSLGLGAAVVIDSFSNEVEVRPVVEINFSDAPTVVVSAAKSNERGRKQASDFVARLREVLAGRPLQ